jgi:hypothetical protein
LGQPSAADGALVRWNWCSRLSDRGWDGMVRRQWGAVQQWFKIQLPVSNRISTLDGGWWYDSNPIFSFSSDRYGSRLITGPVPDLLYDYGLRWRIIY